MKASLLRILLPGAFVAALLILIGIRVSPHNDADKTSSGPEDSNPNAAVSAKTLLREDAPVVPVDEPPGSANRSGTGMGIEDLLTAIAGTKAAIGIGNDPASSESALDSLRRRLAAANPATAAAAVVRFLDSGEDAETGLPFQVGQGGSLPFAPTLRSFLLDQLGSLDPVEGPAYSSRIFADSDSTAEWALAMRNLAWTNSDGSYTGELRFRFGQMLEKNEWIESPDVALLEAFDFGVYLGSRREWDLLTSLVGFETESRGMGIDNAAMMAIDRILLNDRELAFQELESNSSLLAQAPEQRASLAARADVTRAAERRAVESYLLRADLSAAERKAFFELFPHRSYTDGYRLATTGEPRMGLSDVSANDLATLEVVKEWLRDPAFESLSPYLGELDSRLELWAREIRADSLRGGSAPDLPAPSADKSTPGSEGN
jgi:hypothetical protein